MFYFIVFLTPSMVTKISIIHACHSIRPVQLYFKQDNIFELAVIILREVLKPCFRFSNHHWDHFFSRFNITIIKCKTRLK